MNTRKSENRIPSSNERALKMKSEGKTMTKKRQQPPERYETFFSRLLQWTKGKSAIADKIVCSHTNRVNK